MITINGLMLGAACMSMGSCLGQHELCFSTLLAIKTKLNLVYMQLFVELLEVPDA